MASRGLWHFMGARTRRSLALSWSALFVLSLLLQYFTFALAAPALAAVGPNLFELDGNAVDGSGAALPDDWDKINGGGASATSKLFLTDGFNLNDDIFTGGNTKDIDNISSWLWKVGAVQDKDDIENAFAAAYDSGGNTFVYFGLDRYQTSGDATAGFWFLKSAVAKTGNGSGNGSPFSGVHTEGDILVVLDFSNGGSTASAVVYKWHNGALTATGITGTTCDGSVQTVCAIANTAPASSPWVYDDKAANGADNDFPANALFEGGINLTALQLDTGCFSTFIAETRSSTSTTSTLSDMALGSFSLCASPTIATQVKKDGQSTGSNGHITIGESVTDTVTISGTKGTAAGSVEFFSCFNASATPDCSTGGTSRGTKTLAAGSATSDAFTPAAVGNYCFRVEYTPAAGSKYLAGSHTNSTTECFVVDKKPTAITTAANQTVNIGAAIADSATLSGATADAGGTITFKAYGPGDANCSNAAAFTSATFPVSGNGTYGAASFTPTTAGTYRWIASYSGDAHNQASTGACNDAGETDTVNKANPGISTQASGTVVVGGKISDTATVTGGSSPTGTVTFVLYGPGDASCATPIFTSANRPLSGASATSAEFTTTAAGTYRWIATYNGDANNNPVSGACTDANESVIVTKRAPSISTLLHGNGDIGASITVPLGTNVFDTSTLTGATANAGGTVHYRVFTDANCQTLFTDAGTANVVNAVPGNSMSIGFPHAGTFYWQADYSGDANNAAATSACNLEIVTVDKDIPSITTQASATVAVGGAIHDTATLSNGTLPTGTITFKLYGPDDANCSAVIFTDTATVNGNGQYISDDFTTTAAGTYRWVASYSGDSDNAAVSGGCNDANENVDVTKKAPSVTTQASASVEVGGAIHDTATLSGASANATGTITFTLYGPDNATCAGAAIFTSAKTVNGNGQYISADFTPTVAGTYRWIANYGGDANNVATANICNGANENVIVNKKSPTVVTVASASVEVGGKIHDTATLAGATATATGTITFTLYGPDNANCTGQPIFTSAKTVNGNGQYISADFTTVAAGTYRWIANYGGDVNNIATANGCNGADENVIVTKKSPAISTAATPGAQVGDQIHDVATVTGGFNPTGTVTFKLYGPTDSKCESTAIFTDTVALGVNGTATSGNYKVLEQGNFHWVASYSGDANNASATGACGDAGETTVVNQFSPDITTTLHSGNLSGAKITVLFGASVTDQAVLTGASATAGGTVTYKVYTDSTCTTLFANAGAKTVTNGIVPPSNAVVFPDAGTYYWQASYGGDAANAPAISPCTDEVLTVTTPDLHAVKLVKTNAGSFGPTSTANPGDTLTFQITITNNGDADATNVPASDDIADVLAHATYNGDCNLGCNLVGSTLNWTIPTIAKNGGSVVLTFSVTLDDVFPAGTTHLPNVVVVTGPGSNCAAESDDPDCDTDTTVQAQPDLDVTKLVATGDSAFAPTSVAEPGDVLNFQITISNTGNADASNVPVSDDIASVLAHATYNDDCSNSCIVDGTTLKWTIPTIAAGDSVTLTFSVTLDDIFPAGTTHLPNVVVVTGPGSNCAAESEDPDCDTDTTVGAQPDLNVTKLVATNDDEFGPTSQANPGDTLNYEITISNTGNAAATGVDVSDNIAALLAHATYNADCNPGCSFATPTITWNDLSIAVGGSITLTFSVTLSETFPTGTTHLPNVVVVIGPGSNCAAESQDPDCDTDTTVATSLLTIDKGFTGNTAGIDPDLGVPAANIGDTLHYTLTYHGEGKLTNAVITDVLPPGLQYVAGSAAGDANFAFDSYNPATRTLKWVAATLPDPANGAVTYNVKVLATAPELAQPLINVAKIDSDQTEPDSDTAAVAVLAPPLELTPPPTSTLTPLTGTSNPGFALMLILLGVAGLALAIGFVTPAPARVRRRDRLG